MSPHELHKKGLWIRNDNGLNLNGDLPRPTPFMNGFGTGVLVEGSFVFCCSTSPTPPHLIQSGVHHYLNVGREDRVFDLDDTQSHAFICFQISKH